MFQITYLEIIKQSIKNTKLRFKVLRGQEILPLIKNTNMGIINF